MKKWKILNASQKLEKEDLIKALLENRGLKTKKEIDEFLNPKLGNVTTKSVDINKIQLKKAINRIKSAIKNKERIVVFGDYDVDGICGTAILWETLNSLGAKAMPYIPHRIDEGYGLSIKGINNVILNSFQDLGSSGSRLRNKFGMKNNRVQHDNERGLIITVDNGIVANKAVEFANKQGIDVVITDHHVPSNPSTGHSTLRDEPSGSDSKSSGLPKALAIVHTTKLCGAGVAWMLSNVILNSFQDLGSSGNKMLKQVQHDMGENSHLELVALATVADLVPLVGANRTLLAFGLQQLRKTQRIGLKALFEEARIEPEKLGVYEIGHIIAPRLNAMGRLDYAMDSLRLLCTNNRERARKLSQTLGSTNRERQTLTIETVEHAKSAISNQQSAIRRLLFIAHESYQQGVIGLVAGKLVEEFYRPAIVVSVGEKYSKASARSINGFNIIEFIRSASELLVDAGGHPMAAGFTVETSKLSILQKTLEEKAEKLLDEEKLTRTLKIDCEILLTFINQELYDEVQKLSPFGMGNPEPTFVSKDVVIEDMRVVGRENKHLKLQLVCHPDQASPEKDLDSSVASLPQNDKGMIDAIAFGMGERASEFHIGDKVDVVYTIDEDTWNGNKKLQLKIKDMRN